MPVTPAEFGLQGFAFPAGGGAAVCDYPDVSDVRYGVVYGDGAYTGTLGGGNSSSADLAHSPADILRHLLVAKGLGDLPSDGGSTGWSFYQSQQPDSPDNVASFFDTTGTQHGRTAPDKA